MTLQQALNDYLAMRRSLGYRLRAEGVTVKDGRVAAAAITQLDEL